MRLINQLYLHGVLPLFERKTGVGLARRMEQFKGWEWLSADEVRTRQWDALVRLLQHAYNTSAFYRKRFDGANFNPKQPFDPADLHRIPFVTREDMRLNLNEMYSRDYSLDQLSVSATGGTTDTPVKFYRDTNSVRQKVALQWQLSGWAGMYPG